MPIYPYLCSSCGHSKDVLQKIADAPLTKCPSCGAESFNKQLSAPAFQLKGSGWYVTDFRDGNKKPEGADKAGDKSAEKVPDAAAAPVSGAADGTAANPATPAAAPAATPAAPTVTKAPASSPSPSPSSGSSSSGNAAP